MVRKNVIKTVAVTPPADRLIEKIAGVLSLHDVRINGDKGISTSSLIGAGFEVIITTREREGAMFELLQHFALRDKNGEPLEAGLLRKYIKEAYDAMA